MELRLANKDDAKNLEEFLVFNNGEGVRKLASEYINCMFSNDYRKPNFIIAESENNEIVGTAAYSEEFFTTRTWGISWVSVRKDFRHNGLGAKLVEKCLNEISEQVETNVSVILGTYPNKTGLYEKTGFEELGSIDEIGSFMIKTLKKET